MEPVFMTLGHAAGLAAHLSIENNLNVQDIDISVLQSTLSAERGLF